MKIFDRLKQLKNFDKIVSDKNREIEAIESEINNKKQLLTSLSQEVELETNNKKRLIASLNQEAENATKKRDEEASKTKEACEAVIKSYESRGNAAKENFEHIQKQYNEIKDKCVDSAKEINLNTEKVKLLKSFLRKALRTIEDGEEIDVSKLDQLCPTVELSLNSFDVKDLRALIKENQRLTNALLSKYEDRYTTKANKAIYRLMVLVLRAELQNILTDLKFSNIDKCKENLKEMLSKLTQIAYDGNQQIAPTIKSFINEVGVLFEQAIDIEYTYFVRKEQEKAEQQALKEQMRQEAEERKALEQEQKKVEKEESKYKSEITNTEELLANCDDDEKTKKLLARIEELKCLLNKVEEKKEEIINRQNGKAGYVYVISNLGSFGDNRFKVGMTRRLEPMDRVKELGDASVPFAFDVHSFIFSEDAVDLETELHHRLDKNRTNKLNLRKEFFDISLDELEKLVGEICPTAEFKRTMLAIEYRKGLEMAERADKSN